MPSLGQPPRPQLNEDVAKPGRAQAAELILLAGGVVLFLAMLYEMRRPAESGPFVSPVLLAAAGGLLLWPQRDQRPARTVLVAGGAMLLFYLVTELSGVLLPFVLVFLLAYLFNPLATLLQERYRIARTASALVVTGLVVGIFGLFAFQIVPSILGQLETMAVRAIGGVEELQVLLRSTPLLGRFEETGLVDRDELIEQVSSSIEGMADAFAANLPRIAQGIVTHIGSIFGLITVLAIIPVLLFYMLKDYPVIRERLEDLFPTFGGQRDYLVQASEVVGSYLRAQLIICAIGGVIVSIALFLLDVPFALLLGILSGILNLIPNLGAIITAFIGVVVTLLFGDPWLVDTIALLAVLLGQNLLENTVLTPRIMSNQVGLHPVLILLALFVFGYFMGLLGLVIAVPAMALIMTTYKAYRHELVFDLSPEARLKRDLSSRLRVRFSSTHSDDDA